MGERKSFLLRIDEELWVRLERWAQDELRSVNGQIEYLLRQAVLKHTGETDLSSTRTTPSKGSVRKK
jgi:hypothetical protein